MSRWFQTTSVILLATIVPAGRCCARPLYRAVMEKEFQKLGVINCTVCHDGDDKRQRNEYAKKLEAALDGRNIKDEARILAAVKKVGPPAAEAAKPAAVAKPVVAAAVRAPVAIRVVGPVVAVQQAVEVDEDGNEVIINARRFTISHQNLDQWIFGTNKTVDQARTEFESQLKSRIDTLAMLYELDAAQQRKLRLAGRGDIKRFLGEAEALHAELGATTSLDQEAYVELSQKANALRQRYVNSSSRGIGSSLFDEQSLLAKTIPNTIASKFVEKYLADLQRQREQQYEQHVMQSLQNLTNFLKLREDQKETFKKLIQSEIAPPPRFNAYVYTYIMYRLSQLPDEKLGTVLDETQIGKFGQIKANAARYEEYLRANGLLVDEADAGNRDQVQ